MTNEEVHKELFDRVNALERGQSETEVLVGAPHAATVNILNGNDPN